MACVFYRRLRMQHGFFRVASATPECTVGDCGENTAAILSLIKEASDTGVSLIVFPELCITGYTCGDLFSQELICRVSLAAVRLIAEKTKELSITSIVGFPFCWGNSRYNCAAVISHGKIQGIVPKTHIPNYGEFYEVRHFAPAPAESAVIPTGVFGPNEVPFGTRLLFSDEHTPELTFAVEICEDLWVPAPPSSDHVRAGALIIANLSASNEIIGKAAYRRTLVAGQSGRGVCGYIYADAGSGESSTDMVFPGHNLIAENGTIIAEQPLFTPGLLCTDIDIRRLLHERRRMNTFTAPNTPNQSGTEYRRVFFKLDSESGSENTTETRIAPELLRNIDPLPFVPAGQTNLAQRCEEVFALQMTGLTKRFVHTQARSAVIGLSGGLDSTLALLVTVRAFDRLSLPRRGIHAVIMPGFGTTTRTKSNAHKLAEILGVTAEEIRIDKAVRQHFKDIGQNPENLDVTYENSQARERTQILMDKANMTGGLVIGTGDLSELALGWATYNGDHMSMYAVNASVPKTLVRHLVRYCADIPTSFIPDNDPASEPAAEQQATAETTDPDSVEVGKKRATLRKQFSQVLVSILETPVSPELLPPEDGQIAQKTEHIVGPYELHDFFLYHMTRWGCSPAKILFLAEHAFAPDSSMPYTRATILKWMKVFYRRFFSQQFKRSCLPDGPKVGSVTLSPRSDWRMPSDASVAIWIKEVDNLDYTGTHT